MKALHLKSNVVSLLATVAFLSFTACHLFIPDQGPAPEDPEETVVGQIGNPQFNLQFTDTEGFGLHLHVRDPAGNIISWRTPSSDTGGEMDINCECWGCPDGSNENIFWPLDGSAPKGAYMYWVYYYDDCDESNASSSYTVRVLKNGTVVDTKTGTLASGGSTVWTYVHN